MSNGVPNFKPLQNSLCGFPAGVATLEMLQKGHTFRKMAPPFDSRAILPNPKNDWVAPRVIGLYTAYSASII